MAFERVAELHANALMRTRRMRFCLVEPVITVKVAEYGKVTRRNRIPSMVIELASWFPVRGWMTQRENNERGERHGGHRLQY